MPRVARWLITPWSPGDAGVRRTRLSGAPLAVGGLGPLAALLIAGSSVGGPEAVGFPASYRSYTRYATMDRAINDTVRVFYVSPEAARATKADEPVPSGTIIVMEVFKAGLDDAGKPLKGGDGRFVPAELATIMVMEKRAGWGAEYPDDLRNGEWEYAQFRPDGTRHGPPDSRPCRQCHKKMESQDFLFSRPRLGAPATR